MLPHLRGSTEFSFLLTGIFLRGYKKFIVVSLGGTQALGDLSVPAARQLLSQPLAVNSR